MSGRVIVVGSVNVDLVVTTERLPAPGRDRHRRSVRPPSRRQGRQPGRRGGAPRRPDLLHRRRRWRHVRRGGAGGARSGRGIDVGGLLTLADEATGVALILVDETGENSIAVAGGANAALGVGPGPGARSSAWSLTGDVVLVGHEIRTGATHEALRLGRIAGATTILNPAPATGLGRHTLELADILTPNEGELAMLAGPDGSPSARADRLLGPDPGRRAVLVSLGAQGAMLVVGRRARAGPRAAGRCGRHRRRRRHAQRRAGRGAGGRAGPAPRPPGARWSRPRSRSPAPGAREGMPTAAELGAALAG